MKITNTIELVKKTSKKQTTTVLMEDEEKQYHLDKKKQNPYYPRLPKNITPSTLMGFRKRLSNFLDKEQYKAQHSYGGIN
jgi:hypothetical protein